MWSFLFWKDASKCPPEEVGCLCPLTIAILSMSFVGGIVVKGLVLWTTVLCMIHSVTTIWFFNLALTNINVPLSLPVTIYKTGYQPVAPQRFGLQALPMFPGPHLLFQSASWSSSLWTVASLSSTLLLVHSQKR